MAMRLATSQLSPVVTPPPPPTTKPVHPSSWKAFQRHDLKHPGSVDFIIIKQNKLPSFINR